MQASNLFAFLDDCKKAKRNSEELLDFAFAADFLELGSHLVGVFLGQAFLDGLRASRNGFDEVLGFLQAEAEFCADNLDNVEFLCAKALEDNVKFGLLFNGFCCCCGACNCNCGCCCGYAEFFFDRMNEVCEFENGEGLNVIDNFLRLKIFV